MSAFRRLAVVAVAAACGMSTMFSANRNCRPVARSDALEEVMELADWLHDPMEFADSPRERTVHTEALDDVRKAELSRRAERPAGDPKREIGLNYEGVIEGGSKRPKPAEPMPPTYCHQVESVPFAGPDRVHQLTLLLFESMSGFGVQRMLFATNDRGDTVASRTIDRVELVSLLTDEQPSVYILDEIATPALARQAKRRPLDEFERLGLDAVRRGKELVWPREAPTRMFGAIRARKDCLDCHVNAKKGDLLGAFTYYLNAPVDKLKVRE